MINRYVLNTVFFIILFGGSILQSQSQSWEKMSRREKLDSLYRKYNNDSWSIENFKTFDDSIKNINDIFFKSIKVNYNTGSITYRMGANMALKTTGIHAAEYYVKRLLSYDPYVVPNDSTDNKQLQEELKGYLPLPRLAIGLKIGANHTFIGDDNNLKKYSIFEFEEVTDPIYSGRIAWISHLAIPIELNTIRYLSIGFEPGFSLNKIDYTMNVDTLYNLNLPGNHDYRFTFIDLPILVRLHIIPLIFSSEKLKSRFQDRSKNAKNKTGRIIGLNNMYNMNSWYLIAGWKYKYLISAVLNNESIVKALDRRNYDLFIGLGARKYLNTSIIGLEFRYNYGLNKISEPGKRFYQNSDSGNLSSTEQLLFNEYRVVDELHLNSLEFSVIIQYGIGYKAYKLK